MSNDFRAGPVNPEPEKLRETPVLDAIKARAEPPPVEHVAKHDGSCEDWCPGCRSSPVEQGDDPGDFPEEAFEAWFRGHPQWVSGMGKPFRDIWDKTEVAARWAWTRRGEEVKYAQGQTELARRLSKSNREHGEALLKSLKKAEAERDAAREVRDQSTWDKARAVVDAYCADGADADEDERKRLTVFLEQAMVAALASMTEERDAHKADAEKWRHRVLGAEATIGIDQDALAAAQERVKELEDHNGRLLWCLQDQRESAQRCREEGEQAAASFCYVMAVCGDDYPTPERDALRAENARLRELLRECRQRYMREDGELNPCNTWTQLENLKSRVKAALEGE